MMLPRDRTDTKGAGMQDWLTLLPAATARFAAVVETADLDAPLTHCPGWTVRDLVDHLGGVHQWAAHAVATGSPELTPEPAPHAGAAALSSWYAGHAAHLLTVLAQRPADAPAWTMDPADPTAAFWRRRQVHETVLHLWDAEDALGAATPIDPELAWDGVLEVAQVMYPRQVRLGRTAALSPGLRLVATDVAHEVVLGDGEPLEVAAGAELLLRLLWHRADPGAAGVDPRAGVRLAGALTP